MQPFEEWPPDPTLLLVRFLNPFPAMSSPGKVERPSPSARVEAGKYATALPAGDTANLMAEHEDLRQQIASLCANSSTVTGDGMREGEGVMDGTVPPTGRPRPHATNNVAFRREIADLRAELVQIRAEGITNLRMGPPPAYD